MKRVKPTKKIKKSVAKTVSSANVSIAVDTIAHQFMTGYATSVLEDRSIPSIEDGLKPVQRRLLWTMYNLGLQPKGSYMKAMKVVGATMGDYHPHGDASITDALVRLASGIPNPFVDGYGNWGGHASSAAAPRYIECRLSELAYTAFFNPFYLQAMETIPNYDSSSKEPVVLPSIYPMALAIGQSGIAVATTTNIPAFTMESVKKVVHHALSKGEGNKPFKVTAKFLAKHLEFASTYGGKVISPIEDIEAFMSTGKGPVQWECDYKVDSKGTIVLTGFPPEWNFASRTRKIAELPYVAEAMDQSDKDGIRFTIRLKRMNYDERESCIAKIREMMKSVATYRVNINHRAHKTTADLDEVQTTFSSMSLVEVFNNWLEWRLSFLETRALNAEMQALEKKLAKQELKLIAIDGLDVIFKLLKQRGIDKVASLSKALKISPEQAREIWAIAVGQLDRLSLEDVKTTMSALKKEIATAKSDLKQLNKSALKHMKVRDATS